MTNNRVFRQFTLRLGLKAGMAAYTFAMVLLMLAVATTSAPAQTLTVLHSFTNSPDGAYPVAPVLRDDAGNLYGTTSIGGSLTYGALYKIDSAGNESVLLSFDVAPGGAFPAGSLIMDAKGNIYGTAKEGNGGAGVAYELTAEGKEGPLCLSGRAD